MPPYPSYLVYGYVYSSKGIPVNNASLIVTSSVSKRYYNTDSDGIYMFDLAEAGYVDGEIASMLLAEPYNNEIKTYNFLVTGSYLNVDITLIERTDAVNVTGYSPRTILHSVGNKPITSDNPLSVQVVNSGDTFLDLVNNPAVAWTITRDDGQPDAETITLSNGNVYQRTFTYDGSGFLIARTKWIKQ